MVLIMLIRANPGVGQDQVNHKWQGDGIARICPRGWQEKCLLEKSLQLSRKKANTNHRQTRATGAPFRVTLHEKNSKKLPGSSFAIRSGFPFGATWTGLYSIDIEIQWLDSTA